MQNWDLTLPPVSYEHNWYGSMFPATHIKTEPQTTQQAEEQSQTSTSLPPPLSVMEHFLKQSNSNNIDVTSSTSLTPSPRQENNDNHNFFGDINNPITTPINLNNPHIHPLGFNPLTPPGLPNAILPPLNFHQNHNENLQNVHTDSHMQSPPPLSNNKNINQSERTEQQQNQQQQQQKQQQTPDQKDHHDQINNLTKFSTNDNNSLTPRNTPPMDITPPKSPKHYNSSSEYLEKDPDTISNSSDFVESEDDESIRMPIYNSHGKMKNYKCKSCGYNAITKIAFWTHTRTHMKPEKIMQCPKCPFVTELKHHLEYHIRKHKNLKPFQCDKCNYSCVNKSMLNSHLKSHSSVYQYRCSDCDYATKYCHSFKLHLRKYDHKPGLVLDEEGLPNPAIVIDVYGTRRGPKTKSVNGRISHKSKLANSVHAMNNHSNAHKTNLSPLKSTHLTETRIKPDNRINLMSLNQQQSQSQPHLQRLQPSLQQQTQLQTHQAQHHLQQQTQQQQQQQTQQQHQQITSSASQQMQNFLPNSLANMLQQRNMPAFFPYWNLNLQVLAAQQQAVLAQLSPRMREAAIQSLKAQQQQQQQTNECHNLKNESEKFNELQRNSKNNNNGAYNDEHNEDVNANDDCDDDDNDNDNDEDIDHRSESSAMDLSSQGTPTKVQRSATLNFGESIISDTTNNQSGNADHILDVSTPICITNNLGSSSRRKGRVLKLETLLQNKESSISSNDDSLKIHTNEGDRTTNNHKIVNNNIEETKHNNNNNNSNNQMKITSTPVNINNNNIKLRSTSLNSSSSTEELEIIDDQIQNNERESRLSPTIIIPETNIECISSNSNSTGSNCQSISNRLSINDNKNNINNNNNNNNNSHSNGNNNNINNNKSTNNNNNNNNNSSNNNNNNSNNNNSNNNSPLSGIFECKYCDIYFKDAVLYTIHMGYHSCDDVFKCNMCGEKCDGPVGLFVHMARNAHS